MFNELTNFHELIKTAMLFEVTLMLCVLYPCHQQCNMPKMHIFSGSNISTIHCSFLNVLWQYVLKNVYLLLSLFSEMKNKNIGTTIFTFHFYDDNRRTIAPTDTQFPAIKGNKLLST
jgi:hypothetical protein